MKKIIIPSSYNYIEAYLTFACNMKCDYCINKYDSIPMYNIIKSEAWIRALNRIKTRPDLPITLGGGEPTLHPNFYTIVKNIRKETPLDLLTNGTFDIRRFMKEIPPTRFKRDAPYASIRFSYHPGYTDINILLAKVCRMQQEDYSVGIWAVAHPKYKKEINKASRLAIGIGIDFRTKEFLGMYKGKMYGTYKYKFAVDGKAKGAMCKPSELLIAPNGDIHTCHYYLYNNTSSIGNITDKKVINFNGINRCYNCGLCNPCDIKAKVDRFQRKGHCAVEITYENK